MKLILSLLKRTMIELRDIYTKLELDGLLDEKEDSTSMGLIDTESSEREAADNELNDRIEANKANDEAMANVVKWGVYASAMQKMVDEEMAELIRQEFEKAKEEYLKDPTVKKTWNTNSEGVSTNPHYNESPEKPIIDFTVDVSVGTINKNSSFGSKINVPILLTSARNITNILTFNNVFNSPVVAVNATKATASLYRCGVFNSFVILPNVTTCTYLLHMCNKYNKPLNLPKVSNCSYALANALSFNSNIYAPNAITCDKLLQLATAFNQPLSLPNAVHCTFLLAYASAFNQPLSLPKATYCSSMLYGATAFNQVVSLPSASDCISAFTNTAMSSDNISATLDSLPTWTDGSSHVITFTGSPGASELTQDSTSVVNAIAKGWTVEL